MQRGLFVWIIMLCISCQDAENIDPVLYNDQIKTAHFQKMTWVQDPETIVTALFPKLNAEGIYEIKTTTLNPKKATISLKVSPLDDEVISENTTFHFERNDQIWQIKQIRKTLKRRD